MYDACGISKDLPTKIRSGEDVMLVVRFVRNEVVYGGIAALNTVHRLS